jgi:hypothetical protein
VALTHCDLDADNAPDGDCVVRIEVNGGATRQLGEPIAIDDSADASVIALRPDGTGAVLADPNNIHGVLFENPIRIVAPLEWVQRPANPVDIDAGPTSILGGLFAVVDAATPVLRVVGFSTDDNVLREVRVPPLTDVSPVSLSFGRGTDFYLAAGTNVLVYDLDAPNTPPTSVLQATEPLVSVTLQH